MNIVRIAISDEYRSLATTHQDAIDKAFKTMRIHLQDVGQLLAGDELGRSLCFLVSTQGLLGALRQSDRLHPEIELQVFALTSPEEQLSGTVTLSNRHLAKSYSVMFDPPKK